MRGVLAAGSGRCLPAFCCQPPTPCLAWSHQLLLLAPLLPLQCTKTLPGCALCRGPSVCVKCEEQRWPGLGLVAGRCVPCAGFNCGRCDGNPQVCQACVNENNPDGMPFVMDPVTGACEPGLPPPNPAAVAAAKAKQLRLIFGGRATPGQRPGAWRAPWRAVAKPAAVRQPAAARPAVEGKPASKPAALRG